METLLVIIALIVYSFFAIRWGLRFVDGRWKWLEEENMRAIKMAIGVFIGYIGVGIYFLLWCVKAIENLWK